MKATERQVTRETLVKLEKPFALVCEYRGGHDARKFMLFDGFNTQHEAESEGKRIEASKPFADGNGGKRGYADLKWRVEVLHDTEEDMTPVQHNADRWKD